MNNPTPLRVEDSKYKDKYREKLSLDSGNYYIFDKFVIGEVNEGEHFDWETAKVVIQRVYLHFGTTDIKVSYISNRINSYSVQPKDWLIFFKERHKIKSIAVVAYNKMGMMSVVLERIFSKAPIRKFDNLDKAIHWVLNGKSKKVEL
ncbi:MAG: hypothetical protein AAFP76_04280 [Bacteroidota bacterium]